MQDYEGLCRMLQDARCGMQDTGCRIMQDVGCGMLLHPQHPLPQHPSPKTSISEQA